MEKFPKELLEACTEKLLIELPMELQKECPMKLLEKNPLKLLNDFLVKIPEKFPVKPLEEILLELLEILRYPRGISDETLKDNCDGTPEQIPRGTPGEIIGAILEVTPGEI